MSRAELLNALERQQEEEIKQLRREAHDRVVTLRKEAAARLRMARRNMHVLRHQAVDDLRQKQLRGHEVEWRNELSAHRWDLAATCKELAERLLPRLWSQHREELLAKMTSALPDLDWSRLLVARDDIESVDALFPNIPVEGDDRLTGGLIAECRARGLVVDCSLTTCLERLWPTLLPQLMEDIAHACRPMPE